MQNTATMFLTVGHSDRSLEEFLQLLHRHRVSLVVDVRRFPGSRRSPHFNRDELSRALRHSGIRYVHLPGLGGRRKSQSNSPNTGWINASFQGYADYMLTSEFKRNIDELLELGGEDRIALMCAEAVPWRCHRLDARGR